MIVGTHNQEDDGSRREDPSVELDHIVDSRSETLVVLILSLLAEKLRRIKGCLPCARVATSPAVNNSFDLFGQLYSSQ